ncbi:MAG: methylenetetrahydrofolate--tRNA-(uracil(54)-C(5))-methyltransferase (FADH(2)-oxidizing) TrmFO [Bacillales bacterium]|jgi:methylenetetrahydrofolate--tRNA-(uracil-5-)-methyltransferase|nr:methylenetetrahydrofolate--tRNA-(uracil(54)-C(5))-methyltransferase (FADH(2)-oxidizing) TrmFO [Bacillales bacterium]
MEIKIIGAGLAGCEAAYYLSKYQKVKLYEMKPLLKSPAHKTDLFAELVCSNSFKNTLLTSASGLLKAEMQLLNSLIMKAAYYAQVPSGDALSVDREIFSAYITQEIKNNKNIEIINQEVINISSEDITIIATGPLTSDNLSKSINKLLGDSLYFYDAAAPIIHINGIDLNKCYYKSRYDHSPADYLNCPFNKEEFFNFYKELIKAQRVPLKTFEKEINYEGCLPIEVIAKRGFKTLTFGPMKPVGLDNGDKPYAVVQLRQDNIGKDLFNMVGFQTNLTYTEQKRVFSLIPGLKDIQIVRYGLMHRNTYIKSPLYLTQHLNLKSNPLIFFAGQIVGVEGYLESASMGIIAGINALKLLQKKELIDFPNNTIIGSLLFYISNSSMKTFSPMGANYGILQTNTKDKQLISEESLASIQLWKNI